MVPIRDPALIGRKIDCPTCKYRFVVEEPADAKVEEEPAPKGKSGTPAAKGKPGGKPAPAKTKPGRRRDEDEEERPRSKSDGGSTKLVVGLLVGVVGVALIGVAVYFGFIHDGGSSNSKPAPIASNPPPPGTPGGQPTQGTPGTDTGEGVRGRGGILGAGGIGDPTQGQPGQPTAPNPADLYSELTNLLPGDTEGIIHVPYRVLQGTALGRMAFETPGTFTTKEFETRVGIPLHNVERFVQAISFRQNWTFHVVKTTQPINIEAVTKALQLRPAPGGASDYFLSQSSDWVDLLFRYKSAFAPTPLRVLAVKLHDPRTLVFGDEEPIRGFLSASGRFPPVHKGGYLPFPAAEGSATPGGTPPPDPGAAFTFVEPGRQGAGGLTPEAVGPPLRPYYITVPADLKGMLDRLEERPTMVSMAFDTRASRSHLAKFIPTFLSLTLAAGFSPQQVEQGRVLGLAVHSLRNGGLNLQAQLDCADVVASRALRKTLLDNGPKLAKLLEIALGVKATVVNDQAEPAEPAPGGATTEGSGTLLPRPSPGGGIRGGRGELDTLGGSMLGQMGGGRRPGGTPEQPDPTEAASTIEPTRHERTVVLRVNLVFDPDAFGKVQTLVKQHVQALRGDQEMATGQPRWNDVGAATLTLGKTKGDSYPRGTYHREPDGNRAGVPYPPSQRVSWMAGLLPHLGYDVPIHHTKSWQDKDNMPAASMLVSQFLDPRAPRSTWFVRYPGMSQDVGATHIVGMAGIGVDAAEYKMNDPNVKSKLGMFGYDRATKASDITDGTQYTIMMIQVPPTYKRPWMAGGGATVMGVPDPARPSQKSISPFISTEHSGRKGTMAIMADGSVRFIPADTSDEVFKAMCTIQGGDQTFRDDQAPLVKGAENVTAIRTAPMPTSSTITSPAIEWRVFASKEHSFELSFPGKPTEMKEKDRVNIFGNKRDSHAFVVALPNNVRFVAEVESSPGPLSLDVIDQEAEKARTLFKEAKLEMKKITQGSRQGRELRLELPGKLLTLGRLYSVEGKFYTIQVIGPPDKISPSDISKFFDSLKLPK